MRALAVLLILMLPLVFAQLAIPEERTINPPPLPSFSDDRAPNTQSTAKDNVYTSEKVETSELAQNPAINVPADTYALDTANSRIVSLEQEVKTLSEEIERLRAQSSIVTKEKSYLPWIILLVVLFFAISLFLLFRKQQSKKSDIDNYVKQARSAGINDSEIIQTLKQKGWDDNTILSALKS